MTEKMLSWRDIKSGQIWEPCDGTERDVVILSSSSQEIVYTSPSTREIYDKDPFSFQCRYSLKR